MLSFQLIVSRAGQEEISLEPIEVGFPPAILYDCHSIKCLVEQRYPHVCLSKLSMDFRYHSEIPWPMHIGSCGPIIRQALLHLRDALFPLSRESQLPPLKERAVCQPLQNTMVTSNGDGSLSQFLRSLLFTAKVMEHVGETERYS